VRADEIRIAIAVDIALLSLVRKTGQRLVNYAILTYNTAMRVINRKKLDQFKRKHPQSVRPLSGWEAVITQSAYRSFNELRKTFPSADYLSSGYTIFNIGGNKYRLITEIDYSFRMVDIKTVWTHAEYSQSKNAESFRRGQL
jgi:mRNA interferase HigB